MSVQYRAVIWNRQKKIYDGVLAGAVLAYLTAFAALTAGVHPDATIETILIRGFGTAALLLLHVILAIGPLCRLDARFLPLLYNRRHLGVTMFLLAAAHGVFSLVQFHALGDLDPLSSLLTANTRFDSLAEFPFQQFGLAALLILFLMAATSHDFWLHELTPAIWKRLHLLAYAAYGLLIVHVSFGALQAERHPGFVALVGAGAVALVALHLAAARRNPQFAAPAAGGFISAGRVEDIPENQAVVVAAGGESIAVFRHGGRISALSNVCRHQGGPLGEGRIVDGCVTCPWHGYQYRPEDGCSPPPFTDRVPTYRTRVEGGMVLVDPNPSAAGEAVAP